MFSPNSIKIFFSLVFALSFASCGWRQTSGETSATPAPFVAEEIKSGVPFKTKEPENFQFDLIVTTGGGGETKTFEARRGGDYRVDYNAGGNIRISAVNTADGKSFLLLRDKKIYAETSAGQETPSGASSGDLSDVPTSEWLNAKANAGFTNLGVENGLTKYRVNFDGGDNAETLVYVDENISLPVRQEFYSTRGEERSRVYTVEMRNFKLIAGGDLFEIPANYKKVSLENLRAIIKKENSNE